MTFDEVKGLLAQYRANAQLLATLQDTKDIDEIQDMLDEAVKEES